MYDNIENLIVFRHFCHSEGVFVYLTGYYADNTLCCVFDYHAGELFGRTVGIDVSGFKIACFKIVCRSLFAYPL